MRDWFTRYGELKLLYRVSNDPIASGRCAQLASAVRYFGIEIQYAP